MTESKTYVLRNFYGEEAQRLISNINELREQLVHSLGNNKKTKAISEKMDEQYIKLGALCCNGLTEAPCKNTVEYGTIVIL